MVSVSWPPLSELDEAVVRGFIRRRPAVVALGLDDGAVDGECAALCDALATICSTIQIPALTGSGLPDMLPSIPARSLVLLLGRSRLRFARVLIRRSAVPLTVLWRGYVDRSSDHRIETELLPDRLVQRWGVFEVPAVEED